MAQYEYKVVPAPTKGIKVRGIKGAEGRFAHTIEQLMNEMAAEGWEYQRAETLPSEERHGLTQSVTTFRNLLVFRRMNAGEQSTSEPRLLEPPAHGPVPEQETAPEIAPEKKPNPFFRLPPDNGVEGVTDADPSVGSLLRKWAEQVKSRFSS